MTTIVDFRPRRDAACIARAPLSESHHTHFGAGETGAEIILFPRVKKRASKRDGLRKALKRRFTLRMQFDAAEAISCVCV